MASFRIYSTLFIIAALAVCSTASLSLQNFNGAEDHASKAKISTPQPTTPQPTTTTESPHHQDRSLCLTLSPCVRWQDLPYWKKAFLIALVSVMSLATVIAMFCVLDAFIATRKGWGRKFYFAFRDNVCCGFCVRRMRRGKMYEYEEI